MLKVQRLLYAAAAAAFLNHSPAAGQDGLTRLPVPVRAYAEQFKPYCEVLGRSTVITNDMYSDKLFGPPDVNHDGMPDFVAYKCMFGCEGAPFAFVALGLPCSFGALLLSSGSGYKSIPIPGTITQLYLGPPVKIAVNRERIYPTDCGTAFYCGYIFVLRDGWFRLEKDCPPEGCSGLLANRE